MSKKKADYISASQVETFLQCPLAYKYIYIDGAVRTPPNIYISFGSVIHAVLAENNVYKINNKKDLPLNIILERFEKNLRYEYQNNCSKLPYDNIDKIIWQGQELLENYMTEIAPDIKPKLVEHTFTVKLKTYPVSFHGIIDVVTEDDWIIDYKTVGESSMKKWSQEYVDNLTQGTIYSLGFRKLFNKEEKGFMIMILPRVRISPSKVNCIASKRGQDNIVQIMQLGNQIEQIVSKDLFYPNLNSCKDCQFKNSCSKLSII